jgi:hypothetical protein
MRRLIDTEIHAFFPTKDLEPPPRSCGDVGFADKHRRLK